MTTPRKRNPPQCETSKALAESKAMRAEAMERRNARILRLLGEGMRPHEVAESMGLAPSLVTSLTSRLRKKAREAV